MLSFKILGSLALDGSVSQIEFTFRTYKEICNYFKVYEEEDIIQK